MNDIHIRAVLLIVIGVLSIGSCVGLKFAGATGFGIALLFLIGLGALVAAVVTLLFAEPSSKECEE